MITNRLCRFILAVSLVAPLSLVSSAATKPTIVPLRTSVTFSSQSPENRWSVPIKSPDGSTVYVLSLEPDFDVGRHVVTLELVLRHPGDKTDAPNLLDPTGRRHGLQAYEFAADDLARGMQKSACGEKRTVSLKKSGMVVRIAVSKATVSPISAGNYQLDAKTFRSKSTTLIPNRENPHEDARASFLVDVLVCSCPSLRPAGIDSASAR
jgi:hypothetical protein